MQSLKHGRICTNFIILCLGLFDSNSFYEIRKEFGSILCQTLVIFCLFEINGTWNGSGLY